MAVYRYVTTDEDDCGNLLNTPLQECPLCGQDLTLKDSIDLVLSIVGTEVATTSRLDDEGYLQDTEDNAVKNGFHSSTHCCGCGEYLHDLPDVIERYD